MLLSNRRTTTILPTIARSNRINYGVVFIDDHMSFFKAASYMAVSGPQISGVIDIQFIRYTTFPNKLSSILLLSWCFIYLRKSVRLMSPANNSVYLN